MINLSEVNEEVRQGMLQCLEDPKFSEKVIQSLKLWYEAVGNAEIKVVVDAENSKDLIKLAFLEDIGLMLQIAEAISYGGVILDEPALDLFAGGDTDVLTSYNDGFQKGLDDRNIDIDVLFAHWEVVKKERGWGTPEWKLM